MFITWANEKGGVGKSTLAVHMAVWLTDKGFSTALLDADKQGSSSRWLAQFETAITVRRGVSANECVPVAQELLNHHDFVIGDAPAGTGEVTRTLLLLADLALFPVGPSVLDLWSVSEAIEILRYAQRLNRGRPEGRLVLNKIRTRGAISRELRETAPKLGIQVAEHAIRDLEAYRDAVQQCTVVSRFGRKGREAAAEIDRLFGELLGTELARPSVADGRRIGNG